MTRDELLMLAEKHAICTSEAHKEFLHDGLMAFAEEISSAERRKHQADIERWKAEASTAEKWRGLAMAREGANGRVIQEVQEEAAAAEREACANICSGLSEAWSEFHNLARVAAKECEIRIRDRVRQ